jgi:hypothetical protein
MPTSKAMTLPCTHTFHAMALVYHWARNSNVLCPVCRAGPAGQKLVIGKLPREWKYSLGSRVRREQRRDKNEEERSNYEMTIQSSSFRLDIRIEAPPFSSWTVSTQFVPLQNSFVFDVPSTELKSIPYKAGTIIRLVPYTNTRTLQPSNWFEAGRDPRPGSNFDLACDDRGFHHMHLSMNNNEFAELLADAFMVSYA